MHAQEIIATHPHVKGNTNEPLIQCIEECYDCAQACTACADACRRKVRRYPSSMHSLESRLRRHLPGRRRDGLASHGLQ